MLAGGHHFPAVTLVVVAPDAGFLSPDLSPGADQPITGRQGGQGRAIWRGMDPILSTTNPFPWRLIDHGYADSSRRADKPNGCARHLCSHGRWVQPAGRARDFLVQCKPTGPPKPRTQTRGPSSC